MSRPASLPDSMASDDIDQVSEASQETLQTMDTEPPTQGIRDAEFLRKEIPDNEYEVLDSTVAHWSIQKYPQLGNRVTGPEFECGGQRWRILLFPFGNNAQDTISMYLECVHSKEEKDWVVCAQFVLAISNPNDPTVYYLNQAHHRFTSDEADWGFTRFLDLRSATEAGPGAKHPIMEGDSCVATAYIQVVKDPTGILWHNFQDYDSKKQTGHVGLHNQGATCYMNSLLQSLYCTNYFRKATYQIPTDKDDPTKSVALALQRVFYNLQFSSSTVETTELTRSFGWDSLDSFMQHDVQEFNRVLQDNLEEKMKGTAAEGAISKLFVGRMKSFIKCVNVDFESSRIENYYDIQLNVKGCNTLRDSFKDYCAEEMLEGDNKYMAEGHGLQDAKKGVIFEDFPPVLHLQLKRFEYDMLRDTMVKINDRHEFPSRIDLEEFLSPEADRSKSWSYTLHGVLVHSGDLSGGHYFALLKPGKDDKWLKFDDDQVIPVTEREVFEENFGGEALGRHGRGGPAPTMRSVRPLNRYANAYMLVYIRESALDEVLASVTADDIPRHLQDKIEEENRRSEAHKREQLELHLTIETKLITDAIVKPHQGFDLVDFQGSPDDESLKPLAFRVRRAMTAADYKRTVAEKLGKDPHDFRLWIMISRQNKTVRPDLLMPEDPALTIQEIKDTRSPRGMNLRLYVEMRDAHVPNQKFPSEAAHQFLMHLKYFDPLAGTMTGMGPIYVPDTGLIGQILPTLRSRSQLDPDTPLVLFEEIKPGLIEKMD
ncbi:ubiquitin-specific protease ubp15, partial [Dimargaris xerosporica]